MAKEEMNTRRWVPGVGFVFARAPRTVPSPRARRAHAERLALRHPRVIHALIARHQGFAADDLPKEQFLHALIDWTNRRLVQVPSFSSCNSDDHVQDLGH